MNLSLLTIHAGYKIMLEYSFFVNALLAVVLASIASGTMGTYVVVKRISYISGGVAHAILGGVGLAYYFKLNPFYSAVAFALIAAFILGYVKLKSHKHTDTAITTLWTLGMAVGILFMNLTPGYKTDLLSVLFGNILLVGKSQLWQLLAVNGLILASILFFWKQFAFICFDEEYAKLRGLKVNFLYIFLLALIALSVVMLIQVVGIIMVITLLTLPAAISGLYTKRIGTMMLLATAIAGLYTIGGLWLAVGLNLAPGVVIIILLGLSYLVAVGLKKRG